MRYKITQYKYLSIWFIDIRIILPIISEHKKWNTWNFDGGKAIRLFLIESKVCGFLIKKILSLFLSLKIYLHRSIYPSIHPSIRLSSTACSSEAPQTVL